MRYTAADLVEKNRGGIGQNLLDLLDDACTNDLVGERSRSSRYRSVGWLLVVVALFVFFSEILDTLLPIPGEYSG